MNPQTIITIRGRVKKLIPHTVRFALCQTKEHSIFSTVGHEWESVHNGQSRVCNKCMKSEGYDVTNDEWFPYICGENLSTEDIRFLIENSEEAIKIKEELRKSL